MVGSREVHYLERPKISDSEWCQVLESVSRLFEQAFTGSPRFGADRLDKPSFREFWEGVFECGCRED